jgi:hypothetical protein
MSLIAMLLTAGGSAGFGSLLKILGSIFQSVNRARELREEKELLRETNKYEQAIEFQKLFNNESPSIRGTRRILAVISVLTLSVGTLWCLYVPEIPLITVLPGTEGQGGKSFLWGLMDIKASAAPTTVTLGHIALVSMIVNFPMALGFYFTPGGSK